MEFDTVWEGSRAAIEDRVATASSLHPPRVSTARGMNEIPSELQASSWRDRFRVSAMIKATVLVLLTSERCRGDVTVTSRAAGVPRDHTGR